MVTLFVADITSYAAITGYMVVTFEMCEFSTILSVTDSQFSPLVKNNHHVFKRACSLRANAVTCAVSLPIRGTNKSTITSIESSIESN